MAATRAGIASRTAGRRGNCRGVELRDIRLHDSDMGCAGGFAGLRPDANGVASIHPGAGCVDRRRRCGPPRGDHRHPPRGRRLAGLGRLPGLCPPVFGRRVRQPAFGLLVTSPTDGGGDLPVRSWSRVGGTGRAQPVSGPVLAGLAGFTGFAISTFTYFLGRSHPNNALNLLVPICALGCLWASTSPLPRERELRGWRMVPVAVVLTVFALLSVYSLPFATQKWHQTAFAQTVPFQPGSRPESKGCRCALPIRPVGRTNPRRPFRRQRSGVAATR